MGMNRQIRRNKEKQLKKDIELFKEELNNMNVILKDYIPRAEQIHKALVKGDTYFSDIEPNEEILNKIRSLKVESEELLDKMTEVEKDVKDILNKNIDEYLRDADNRLLVSEIINIGYYTKAAMIQLHKEFTLYIEEEITK